MTDATTSRDLFTSRLGVLAATLGSAVGLGNIWKFPALTGQNGGASFLAVYLLSTLCIGLPLMIMELSIGRTTRANAIKAFRRLAPRSGWWLLGAGAVVSAVLILGFYTDVAGWVFAYVFKSAAGGVATSDPAEAQRHFQDLTTSPWQSLFWQWVVLGVTASVIIRGASAGIERVTRLLMPVLFLLLVVLCLRSLTLPGAAEGLRFLFLPQWDRINGSVVLMAMGLAFFKMSVGMGCMLTYGSYFRRDMNIPLTGTRVMFCDLLVSLLAGVAIFPAVFSFGFEPTEGPALLFLTIPAVFAAMPGGAFFTAIFFALSAIAATGAMLSLLEVPVVWISETFHMSRPRAVALTVLGLILLGIPATLSIGPLARTTVFGHTFFQLYDAISSNGLMPLGGLGLSLFVGYFWGRDNVLAALTNNGALRNTHGAVLLLWLCRTLTPVFILLVLCNGLGLLR